MSVQEIKPFHKEKKLKYEDNIRKIKAYQKNGYSIRQIMKLMKWKSPQAVQYYLK